MSYSVGSHKLPSVGNMYSVVDGMEWNVDSLKSGHPV